MNHSIKCKSAVKYHISMYDMILNDRRYLKYSNTKMLRHFLTNMNLILYRIHPEFQISEVSHGKMEIVCYNDEFYHLSDRSPTLAKVSPRTTPNSLLSPSSKLNPGLP